MRPARLNAAIACLFVVGSSCFVLGSVPAYAGAVGDDADAWTYFIGSLFFTSAAFLQLVQAQVYGPRPRDRNWLAAVTQFPGTLFFNVSTLVALVHNLSVQQEDRHVWRPDMFGSTLFLVAGVFGVLAAGGGWRGRWIAWLNMVGSIFFMASALAGYILPSSGQVLALRADLAGTLLGALCFLVGAVLLVPVRPYLRRAHDRHERRRPLRQPVRHARGADADVPGRRDDGPGRLSARLRRPGPRR
ncbi:YrhK family protein [Actinoplanes sp. CA-131856]